MFILTGSQKGQQRGLVRHDAWTQHGLRDRAPHPVGMPLSTSFLEGKLPRARNLQVHWPGFSASGILSKKMGLAEGHGLNKHVYSPFNTPYKIIRRFLHR